MSTVNCSAAPALPMPSDVAGISGGGTTPAPAPAASEAAAPVAAPVDIQTTIAELQTAVGALSQAVAGMGAISGGGGTPAELPVDQSVTGGGAGSGCGCGGGQAVAGAGSVTQDPGGSVMQEPTNKFAEQKEKGRRSRKPSGDQAPPSGQAPPPGTPSTAPSGTKLRNPLQGAKMTSGFGHVSSIRNNRPHGGTDLAKPQGAPISAAAPGKVVEVKNDSDGYGNYVTIDHGNGKFTRYAHMVETSPLKQGQTVAAGQNIGKVGSTGNSTGPHLHFEVLIGGMGQGNRVDPAPYLSGSKTL